MFVSVLVISGYIVLSLCQLFNDHYINIVQNSSGRKPTNVADTTALVDDRDIVKLILETYKTHPSILAITEHRGVVFRILFI